jgi:hypothetical protein
MKSKGWKNILAGKNIKNIESSTKLMCKNYMLSWTSA